MTTLSDPGEVFMNGWRTAVPFPHIIWDDFLPEGEAAKVAAEFPPPADPRWHTFTGPLEEGKQEGDAVIAGARVWAVHAFLASSDFIGWLRVATGIGDLVADPDRVGGGVHQSAAGARLGMHVDFNVHPVRGHLLRAVNVILFLDTVPDADSDEGRGGWLQLQRDGITLAVQPMAGRLVVFEANDRNYHGHPIPMTAAQGLRRSIPAYYYRPIRPDERVVPHSTRFLDES